MRVALLTNILTPYRLPVYRDLANTPGLELKILLSAPSEFHWEDAYRAAYERGREEFDVELVSGTSLRRRVAIHRASGTSHHVELHLPTGVLGALRQAAPDVIVSSELGLRTGLATVYAAAFGVPLVIWSYASRSFHEASSGVQRLRRRLLLGRADAVVGMGRQAREVLLDLGVAADRLFDAPNAHDLPGIEAGLARVDPLAARAAVRARLGARERIALVVGRLVPQKGVERILDAWRRVPGTAREDWSLVFVGDGPEAARVRQAAERLPGEVVHVPAVVPGALPEIYAASDLLVFPSLGDAWGLVVNEAQTAGVPVLCSTLAGCVDDLVEPGRTGWRFDPTDAERTAAALETALCSEDLPRMGELARDVAKRCSPEAMAGGLRQAIFHAAARRRSAAP